MINTNRKSSSWIINNPIEAEIAKGHVVGVSGLMSFGNKDNIFITYGGSHDIWGGTTISPDIPNQLGGEQMMLISSNYNDRLNGTGIRKVEIDYLNARGVESYETVSLDGTKFVRTVGTNIRFINGLHAIETGAGVISSGDVFLCANGTISTVFDMIPVGLNSSTTINKMIPYNKTFYLQDWAASSAGVRSKLFLRSTSKHGTRIVDVPILIDFVNVGANDSFVKKAFNIPIKIPQLSIIKVTAMPNASGAYISAAFNGFLEDNS